eukprot:jgi/Botrbrau1/11313/Bobra.0038s0074.1
MQDIDIAIAGGGPAGLAAANAVRAVFGDNVQVQVFETSPSITVAGSVVLMNLNGQAALEAIDPVLLARMEQQAVFADDKLVRFSKDGTPMGPRPVQVHPNGKRAPSGFTREFEDLYGRRWFILGWHEIRKVLYDNLPPGIVQHGRRVTGYSTDDSGLVRVKFQEGEDVRARILIGADGYRSCIRAQLLDDAEPEFTGSVMWRARAPFSLSDASFGISTMWLDGEMLPGKLRRFITFTKMTSDSAALICYSSLEEMTKRGVEYDPSKASSGSIQAESGHGGLKQRCLTAMEGFEPRIYSLVEAIEADRFTEHGLFLRPVILLPDGGYGEGGVTLMGDASHMGPPNGLGVNLAIEDAVILAHNLRQYGITPEALRSYEAERVPRIKEVLSKTAEDVESEDKVRLIYKAKFPSLQASEGASAPDLASAGARGAAAATACLVSMRGGKQAGGGVKVPGRREWRAKLSSQPPSKGLFRKRLREGIPARPAARALLFLR